MDKRTNMTIWERIDKLKMSTYVQYTDKKTRKKIEQRIEQIEQDGRVFRLTIEKARIYYKEVFN